MACLRKSAFAIASAAMFSTLYAAHLVELPLGTKVHDAEFIFVGEVISSGVTFVKDNSKDAADLMSLYPDRFSELGWDIDYCVIRVQKILKGNIPTKEIKFVIGGPDPEANPTGCCKKGAAYLFFATGWESLLHSVNGKFGVYPILNNKVPGWQSDQRGKEESLTTVENEIKEAMKSKQ